MGRKTVKTASMNQLSRLFLALATFMIGLYLHSTHSVLSHFYCRLESFGELAYRRRRRRRRRRHHHHHHYHHHHTRIYRACK